MNANALDGGLPPRYRHDEWQRPFMRAVEEVLRPNIAVLDIGSGRRPTLAPTARPSNCTYVGFDIAAPELAAAPPGSYNEMVTGDVTRRRSELEGRFDLVVCWQVLEHVKPLEDALGNIRSYLRPAGRFVGHLSGTFAPFGLVNRVFPHRFAATALHRFLHRDPTTVFPAYYDRCWYSALVELGQPWAEFSVEPRYAGATYLQFWPALQRAYLRYEGWTIRRDYRNLATHYLLVGRR